VPMLRKGLTRPWTLAVVGTGAFLLLSMGGAIVAAPLTLPLLYLAARREAAGPALRAAAVAIAALTVAEVAWAATYLAVTEAQPWIWAVPMAAGIATVVAFARPRPALATA
jgi:hypothetical protein